MPKDYRADRPAPLVLMLSGCGLFQSDAVVEQPAGWQQLIDTMQPNGPAVSDGGLTLQVMGDCESNNGLGILLTASGFPPNGSYFSRAFNPDGSLYENYGNVSRFDKFGQPSDWSWNCYYTDTGQRDPPGPYRMEFQDTTAGSPTEGTTLEVVINVGYPSG